MLCSNWTLAAVKHPVLVPGAVLVHAGPSTTPNFSKRFWTTTNTVKVLRVGDTVICDKGYYAYNHFAIIVRDFKAILLIISQKTFDVKKLLRKMNYLTLDLLPS